MSQDSKTNAITLADCEELLKKCQYIPFWKRLGGFILKRFSLTVRKNERFKKYFLRVFTTYWLCSYLTIEIIKALLC